MKKKDKKDHIYEYSVDDNMDMIEYALKNSPKMYKLVMSALDDKVELITIVINPISKPRGVLVQVICGKKTECGIIDDQNKFLELANEIGEILLYPIFISITRKYISAYAVTDCVDPDDNILYMESDETLNDFINRINRS